MIPVKYNLRSLSQRKATTLATGLGIGLVVFVFASVLMLSAGIHKTMVISGKPEIALVIRKGSDGELSSAIASRPSRSRAARTASRTAWARWSW
jgi:putative ABC transport system permease protein